MEFGQTLGPHFLLASSAAHPLDRTALQFAPPTPLICILAGRPPTLGFATSGSLCAPRKPAAPLEACGMVNKGRKVGSVWSIQQRKGENERRARVWLWTLGVARTPALCRCKLGCWEGGLKLLFPGAKPEALLPPGRAAPRQRQNAKVGKTGGLRSRPREPEWVWEPLPAATRPGACGRRLTRPRRQRAVGAQRGTGL